MEEEKKINLNVLRTCVSPEGRFVYGLHRPRFQVANLRQQDFLQALGEADNGRPYMNTANFPPDDVEEPSGQAIFEIPNPFPFRGTTYIGKEWADRTAADLDRIRIEHRPDVSLTRSLQKGKSDKPRNQKKTDQVFADLPETVQLAVAATSTDSEDLVRLAELSCSFVRDPDSGRPVGLIYESVKGGKIRPKILNPRLFDLVANNPYLPDSYKMVMVLRPGVQGQSEIMGEWQQAGSHVFEYLRRNSYIPWGHYAANMAHDAVRYDIGELKAIDVTGMRHLYYQRTYVRLAQDLKIPLPPKRKALSASGLEELRQTIITQIHKPLSFTATLWGWNYGFDFAPSGYRLHASHQQIHQQFAMIPEQVPSANGDDTMLPAYACGDLVYGFIKQYRQHTGKDFFPCYLKGINANRRLDGEISGPSSLVVYQDDQVMLFVPKAQTSQWELQLMSLKPVGHIVEADAKMRQALDRALLTAMRILTTMGAAMITVIEYSKRFKVTDCDQRLLYAFLPRLPESPGAFSEAQLRWINGHYPEDFAEACRQRLDAL